MPEKIEWEKKRYLIEEAGERVFLEIALGIRAIKKWFNKPKTGPEKIMKFIELGVALLLLYDVFFNTRGW